jgi:hypothetical protein
MSFERIKESTMFRAQVAAASGAIPAMVWAIVRAWASATAIQKTGVAYLF